MSRELPYAFTEHGVLMLASVLNSERTVQVSIALVNVFVKLRDHFSDLCAIALDPVDSLRHAVGVGIGPNTELDGLGVATAQSK